MRYVWACGGAGCLAADIQRALEHEQPVALTTVLTTLDRLLQKGIVHREREGKAHRYGALVTEQELEQRIVAGVLDNLIARFPRAVATYFSQAGGEQASLTDPARRMAQLKRQSEPQEDTDV
jgi:predicted transcriptional regulator